MEMLNSIFVKPFADMIAAPDFLMQVVWEGLVSGVLYALIALGFVLIYKSSRIFNFAQGIMVVFAALTLVGLYEKGVPAWLALILAIGAMGVLAMAIERFVMRPLVNQPDIILLMSTIGLTYFLVGFGELLFGGEPKQMITQQLGLPTGSITWEPGGWGSGGSDGLVIFQEIDIAAAVPIASPQRLPMQPLNPCPATCRFPLSDSRAMSCAVLPSNRGWMHTISRTRILPARRSFFSTARPTRSAALSLRATSHQRRSRIATGSSWSAQRAN